MAMEHHARIRHELLDVQLQKRVLEAKLRAELNAGRRAAREVPEADVDRAIAEHPAVAELAAKLVDQRAQLAAAMAKMRTRARSELSSDPALKQLNDRVRETERLIKQRELAVRPEVTRQLQESNSSKAIEKLKIELAMLIELEKNLSADLKSADEFTARLQRSTVDFPPGDHSPIDLKNRVQGGALADDEPEQAAEAFLAESRKLAETRIESLKWEAERLRSRLEKIEGGIRRWETVLRALQSGPADAPR
jgi:hypothetical protein